VTKCSSCIIVKLQSERFVNKLMSTTSLHCVISPIFIGLGTREGPEEQAAARCLFNFCALYYSTLGLSIMLSII
jgi:hypothetical protein